MLRKEKGFTLIELLIVIVIIGILAGVLISVIDPTAQQNRARDAGIEASISKVALATEGYISAYGEAPDEVQFLGQFKTDTVRDSGNTCASVGGFVCHFEVTGNQLPATCAGNGYAGTGTGQCYFRYVGVVAAGDFTVYAKSAGLTDKVFRFENYGTSASMIQTCNAANPGNNPGGTCN